MHLTDRQEGTDDWSAVRDILIGIIKGFPFFLYNVHTF